MLVWWSIGAGVHVEPHTHENEQIVWMLKGNEQRVCGPGDVVVIPGGAEHEGLFREDTEVRGQTSKIPGSLSAANAAKIRVRERCLSVYPGTGSLGAAMKEALQTTLILVVWILFWLGGTFGGAVLQARLIDIGVMSDIDPPWIITIGSSFIGFFAGAYAAVKLGDLTLRKND